MAIFWKDQVNKLLVALGLDVRPHTSYRHIYRLRQLILEQNRINLVLDAGAGQGGYVRQLRKSGYRGRAISFEPMRDPYSRLAKRVAGDPFGRVETRLSESRMGQPRSTSLIILSAALYCPSQIYIRERLPRQNTFAPSEFKLPASIHPR